MDGEDNENVTPIKAEKPIQRFMRKGEGVTGKFKGKINYPAIGLAKAHSTPKQDDVVLDEYQTENSNGEDVYIQSLEGHAIRKQPLGSRSNGFGGTKYSDKGSSHGPSSSESEIVEPSAIAHENTEDFEIAERMVQSARQPNFVVLEQPIVSPLGQRKSNLQEDGRHFNRYNTMPRQIHTPSQMSSTGSNFTATIMQRNNYFDRDSYSSSPSAIHGKINSLGSIPETETPRTKSSYRDRYDQSQVNPLEDQLEHQILTIDYAFTQLKARMDMVFVVREKRLGEVEDDLKGQIMSFEQEKRIIHEKNTQYQKTIQRLKEENEELKKGNALAKQENETLKGKYLAASTKVSNIRTKLSTVEKEYKDEVAKKNEEIANLRKRLERKYSLNQTDPGYYNDASSNANQVGERHKRNSYPEEMNHGNDRIGTSSRRASYGLNSSIKQSPTCCHHDNGHIELSVPNKQVKWQNPVAETQAFETVVDSIMIDRDNSTGSVSHEEEINSHMKKIKFDINSDSDCVGIFSDKRSQTVYLSKNCGCQVYKYSNGDRRWVHSDSVYELYYMALEGTNIVSIMDEWTILFQSGTGQLEISRSDGQKIVINRDGVRTDLRKSTNGTYIAEIYKGRKKVTVTSITLKTEIKDTKNPVLWKDSRMEHGENNIYRFETSSFKLNRSSEGQVKIILMLVQTKDEISLLVEDVTCVKHVTKKNDVTIKETCLLWGKSAKAVVPIPVNTGTS